MQEICMYVLGQTHYKMISCNIWLPVVIHKSKTRNNALDVFLGHGNYNCKSRFFLSFGKTTISVNEGEEYIAKTLGSCKLYVL